MFGLLIVHRCGSEHVLVLKDKTDRIIHFGSTGDPSFHIAHNEVISMIRCLAGARAGLATFYIIFGSLLRVIPNLLKTF